MRSDRNKYRILVAEDNKGDFILVEDFLFDYIEAPEILQAINYQEATKYLTAEHHKFDVILLDLSLPDMTGELLIQNILALCEGAPVIVLTGYADFAFGIKSLALGAADYLLKDDLTALSLYKSVVYSIERKKNVTALADSEKRYSELFNFSPVPMWVVDMDTLYFLDVNKATVDHYGYTREEFMFMTLKDIRPDEDIPKLLEVLASDEQRLYENYNRVMTHKLKSGQLRQVEIQIAPIKSEGRKISIVIANDITDRLNYIKAIEDQNQKLKEISWIQSHIVRAPLSRIMGLVSLIEASAKTDEELMQMLGYLNLSANELDDIIRDITKKTELANYQLSPERK